MTTATTLSVLALALSVLSLNWQAWTWFRSGPVLRVESNVVITDAASISGAPDLYIQIRVSNHGRAGATITGFGVETPGKNNLFQFQPLPFSTRLPARIDAHADASFYMPVEGIRSVAAERQLGSRDLRAWAQPASSRKVYAKTHLPL